jgi:hypothetical protein
MVQPILLYGSEIWAMFGWTKNDTHHITKYLLNANLKFEKLHSKMCRNILGVHRKATEILVKAELGRYPLMSNIAKHTYTYWQYILDSKQDQLLYAALIENLEQNNKGKLNYFARINAFFTTLNTPEYIHKQKTEKLAKEKANMVKKEYKTLYENFFFDDLKKKATRPNSGGRYTIYNLVKNNYKFDNYLSTLNKGNLRRNISNIRLSTHNLPIERLRKMNIERKERLCPLCHTNELGCEFHTLMSCPNAQLVMYRQTLNNKLATINPQWNSLACKEQFQYLILASDKTFNFYFSIYLDKIYSLIKNTYSQKNT